MKLKEIIKRSKPIAEPYCVTDGKNFRLKDVDPADTQGLKSEDKPRAKEALRVGVEALAELQDMLYAQDRWALLVIFQAMDAAGKDGAIKHVMSGINPQGCQVFSFKSPSAEELDHDFMWRCLKQLPERGRIGIFNRSYYEETSAVRINPVFLASQKLPSELVKKELWDELFRDISNCEKYRSCNGVVVSKFFLHVSKGEQKKRLLERIDKPAKNWKFSSNDANERKYWKDYMKVYEETIRNTATDYAPWYVIPADNKWFTRLAVAASVITTLASLNLAYPTISKDKIKELESARQALMDEANQ